MKSIYLSLLFFSALSCVSEKEVVSEKNDSTPVSTINQKKINKATIGEKSSVSNPIQITSVSINGNIMTIEVSYSGGCKLHEFQVIGSSMIAKSMPPIRSMQLIHTSNGDECKKLINETLTIDVSDLAYKKEKGSEIFLTLDGWKEKVKYIFE